MARARRRGHGPRVDLSVRVGEVALPNPVMTAAGTAGHGDSIDLTFDFTVEQQAVTGMRQGVFGRGLDFLQLRGTYRVSGRAGPRDVEFTAPGAAETFRGRPAGR